ncbi:hypothetical protein IGI04_017021 [Brassica rapa subsp. trilocularis]|uniref:Uncharacterized protein n=1 Tax=Brassica rapa subsp. trilocularis TaxID=1813537 RepID=A0ABQ7MUN4_BRACM|nr:hypothetical protein IGI04_017021 [Brassica rapa subsp. trilocularis]
MMPNLRCLVAKAYRVRQVRAFCSSFSSSAPNPIGDKGGNCIVRYLINNDAWETLAMQQELLYLDMYES